MALPTRWRSVHRRFTRVWYQITFDRSIYIGLSSFHRGATNANGETPVENGIRVLRSSGPDGQTDGTIPTPDETGTPRRAFITVPPRWAS